MKKFVSKISRKNQSLQPVKEILEQFLNKNPDLFESRMNALLQNWDKIVGEYLSKKIYPLRIEKGILLCATSSSSLVQEISLLEPKIILKLKKYPFSKDIKGLRFKVTDIDKNSTDSRTQLTKNPSSSQSLVPRPLTLIETTHLHALSLVMKDPENQKRLFSLLKALEQRKKTLKFNHWKHCMFCQSFFHPNNETCPYCNRVLCSN